MNRLKELLEEYSSNKTRFINDKYFKFLNTLYKAAVSTGALNISLIYDTLNNNSPRVMDREFMKTYINSLTPGNTAMIIMFEDYWTEGMGDILLDGLPETYKLSLRDEDVFAALVANNDIEKVIKLLNIAADRINSITEKYKESDFYSKCLSDFPVDDFKDTLVGLQFLDKEKAGLQAFGFSIAEGKADNIRREQLKQMNEDAKAYNEKLKEEGKGFFERIKLNYKFRSERIEKIQKEYYKNIDNFSKKEENNYSPITSEIINYHLKLTEIAFKALEKAYKKYLDVKEIDKIRKEAPDDEWGSWDAFIAGKTKKYSIAVVSWDQEDWLNSGDDLISSANEILKKEGYGENILSIGGDGDEGIVDIDTRRAKINFDKLK